MVCFPPHMPREMQCWLRGRNFWNVVQNLFCTGLSHWYKTYSWNSSEMPCSNQILKWATLDTFFCPPHNKRNCICLIFTCLHSSSHFSGVGWEAWSNLTEGGQVAGRNGKARPRGHSVTILYDPVARRGRWSHAELVPGR